MKRKEVQPASFIKGKKKCKVDSKDTNVISTAEDKDLSTIATSSEASTDAARNKPNEVSEKKSEELSSSHTTINFINEISSKVAEWKLFGQALGLDATFLKKLERKQSLSQTVDRNKDVIMEALKMFDEENIHFDQNSWKCWRFYLNKFSNGREVIAYMERYFPEIIAEISSELVHEIAHEKMIYVGHPIHYEKSFEIYKSNSEIAVNIGSNNFQMIHYQDIQEWSQTQQRYLDVFNLFKHEMIFNFDNLNEYCPILQTLGQYLKDTDDNGFAVKGYYPEKHLKWFDQSIYVNNYQCNNYFCFIGKENVIINFTICNKEVGHAFHYSSQNILAANALHKELQSKDIIQVNVLVHNGDTNMNLCEACVDKNLYIHEDVLFNVELFKSWFNELCKIFHKIRCEANLSTAPSTNQIIKNLKKEIISYEALQNTEVFPSFSRRGESQMNELKKCVILPTLVQFTILHINEKHIFIRGSYGSGKSIVLRKKLEKCLSLTNDDDIFYYICCDQQSKFRFVMDSIKSDFPNKNIITCVTLKFLSMKKPTLSLILNHIHHYWRDKTVHVFVDEFSGAYISKREVQKLKEILPAFSNSFIVIALQSMEEYVCGDESVEIDVGYEFDLLKEQTSFEIYNLDYSLRCSMEINNFVTATSQCLESNEIPVMEIEDMFVCLTFVDRDYVREKNHPNINNPTTKSKFSYNTASPFGHSSSSGPVSLFVFDKADAKSYKMQDPSDICVHKVYVGTLQYILSDLCPVESHKMAICTYDEDLYNIVYYYLENELANTVWTNDIWKFTQSNSKYNILLTDYASVRGYEFTNFIFLLRIGGKYLKYRMIECFTRATTNLYVITDNVKCCNKSLIDKSFVDALFIAWRNLPAKDIDYLSLNYNESIDTLKILQSGETKCEKQINVSGLYFKRSFPWIEPKEAEKTEVNIFNDMGSVDDAIGYLCENDNASLIFDFCQVNKIDILKYQGNLPPGDSLIHIASWHGSISIVKFLISECHIDINVRNASEETALHQVLSLASKTFPFLNDKKASIMEKFTDSITKITINYQTYGQGARSRDFSEFVQFLIDNGADIHAKDHEGQTPLHIAALSGRIYFVQLLVNNGADICSENCNGQTPLHVASLCGEVNVIQFLVDNGANIHVKDHEGQTPLHVAASSGNVDFVQLLINNGGDIHAKNYKGQTPLHVAASSGNAEVFQLLVNNGSNIRVKDHKGQTVVHAASSSRSVEIIQWLIYNEADIHAEDVYGQTPLHIAGKKRHKKIFELLIHYNADIYAQDKWGKAPTLKPRSIFGICCSIV